MVRWPVVLVAAAMTSALAPSLSLARPRWETLPRPPPMPRPDATGNVEVDGAKIFYAVYEPRARDGAPDPGAEARSPVVLLHGGLGNSGHFGFQLPALADRFQVIAIDSRGQGRSTRGSAAITYDQMAVDVIAVLDRLAIPRASVVGWSDGGEVALKLGIAYPDRVDRLFVFGTNYDASGSKPRSGPSPTFSAYAARCRVEYERLSRSGVPYKAMVSALLPLWRKPIGITKDQLRAIRAPVMVADGDRDEIILLEHVEEMADLIPNAQLTVFADASHFALWQDPEAFNRAMVGFLMPPDPATGSRNDATALP